MSVFGLMRAFGSVFRVRYPSDYAVIDNAVFRLHYRFTSVFFFASCALVTASEFFGKPIQCIPMGSIKHDSFVNTFCWIQHTFTIYPNNNQSQMAHPGVGPYDPEDPHGVRVHSYYQWVPFVLFLQGILFYFPHWLWKARAGGLLRDLTAGSRGCSMGETRMERRVRSIALANYLATTKGSRNRFAVSYVVCEVLNLVNAVGNIYLIDVFLGGVFFNYGLAALMDGDDALIGVFPRVAKCTFQRFGASGNIEKLDTMCVLSLNVINEKIYIFVWFWLALLSCASLLVLFSRLVLILSPWLRGMSIYSAAKFADRSAIINMIRRTPIGDYFLLYLLARNMEEDGFKALLENMMDKSDHNIQLIETSP